MKMGNKNIPIAVLVGIFVTILCHVTEAQEMPQATTTISVVNHDQVSQLGEGPYWDKDEKVLYYVDAVAGEFYKLNPATKELTKRTVGPGLVSIIIPYRAEPGSFIVTNANKVLKLNWETSESTLLATVAPELNGQERFNDAKCDPMGRLFIGTVLENPGGGPVAEGGSLYRLESDGNFTKLSTGFTISNGMSWSNDPESKKFYFNDSEGRKIYSFDYCIQTGNISNKTLMIDLDNHPDFVADEYPDGMAIDRYGYIWVALWNGGRVVKINPETARVVDQVVFPRVKIPSSLAFGDYEGQYGLYVTTAATGVPDLKDEGKIHHINIIGGEVKGFDPSA